MLSPTLTMQSVLVCGKNLKTNCLELDRKIHWKFNSTSHYSNCLSFEVRKIVFNIHISYHSRQEKNETGEDTKEAKQEETEESTT